MPESPAAPDCSGVLLLRGRGGGSAVMEAALMLAWAWAASAATWAAAAESRATWSVAEMVPEALTVTAPSPDGGSTTMLVPPMMRLTGARASCAAGTLSLDPAWAKSATPGKMLSQVFAATFFETDQERESAWRSPRPPEAGLGGPMAVCQPNRLRVWSHWVLMARLTRLGSTPSSATLRPAPMAAPLMLALMGTPKPSMNAMPCQGS